LGISGFEHWGLGFQGEHWGLGFQGGVNIGVWDLRWLTIMAPHKLSFSLSFSLSLSLSLPPPFFLSLGPGHHIGFKDILRGGAWFLSTPPHRSDSVADSGFRVEGFVFRV
jgi:hypothetical protein